MKRSVPVLILTLIIIFLVPATAQASRFQIGPVSGITTAWHPAPGTMAVPLGTTLTFKRQAPAGSTVTWTGAQEMSRDQGWSVAECHLYDVGRHVVQVEIVFAGGGRIEESATIDVVAIDPAQISVTPIQVSVDPVELDEDDLNASTYEYFLGHSIAALRQVAPYRYRTSTNRPVELSVEVDPPAFAALTEWRTPGRPARLGSSRTVTHHQPRREWIYAGPTANQKAIFLETYKVRITSHVSNHDIIPTGTDVTFTAVTEPPGFEEEITWLASTKYGGSEPVMGSGPEFTVWFEDTWGPNPATGEPFQWLGVKADNAVYNQDPKTRFADLSAVTGYFDLEPLLEEFPFLFPPGPAGAKHHEISIEERCPERDEMGMLLPNNGDGDGDMVMDDRQLDLNGMGPGKPQLAPNGSLELWCIDRSYYALVWDPAGPADKRFVGKCPFGRGYNEGWKYINPRTLHVQSIQWQSTDHGADDDADGKQDRWDYEYDPADDILEQDHFEDGTRQADSATPGPPPEKPFDFKDLLPKNPRDDDPQAEPTSFADEEPMAGDRPILEVNTDVEVTISTTIANDGPLELADADWTVLVEAPDSCTVNGDLTATISHLTTVDQAELSEVVDIFTIRCFSPGTHVFTLSTLVEPAAPDVLDLVPEDDFSLTTLTVEARVP